MYNTRFRQTKTLCFVIQENSRTRLPLDSLSYQIRRAYAEEVENNAGFIKKILGYMKVKLNGQINVACRRTEKEWETSGYSLSIGKPQASVNGMRNAESGGLGGST